jgi:hypothetical protein
MAVNWYPHLIHVLKKMANFIHMQQKKAYFTCYVHICALLRLMLLMFLVSKPGDLRFSFKKSLKIYTQRSKLHSAYLAVDPRVSHWAGVCAEFSRPVHVFKIKIIIAPHDVRSTKFTVSIFSFYNMRPKKTSGSCGRPGSLAK